MIEEPAKLVTDSAISTTVILFVGHGTRVTAGVSEFLQFCRLVEQRIHEYRDTELHVQDKCSLNRMALRFEWAFLEITEPGLVSTLIRCCTPDVSEVYIVPLFLFQAGHMKQDIPGLIETARPKIGSVKVELLPAIGVDLAFIEATVTRLTEAGYVQVSAGVGAGESPAVLLLGRGNKDNSAQNDFELLASRVKQEAGAFFFETGYLAGSGRDWRDALSALVETGARLVYIQPYLWFHGWLTEQLPKWIEDWIENWMKDWRQKTLCQDGVIDTNQLQIRVGEPLGVHQALVSSVADRVLTVLLHK